jgi:hypothetical protein
MRLLQRIWTTKTPTPPHRSRWKRPMLVVFFLLLLLFVLSPILVAGTPLRNWLLVHALPPFPGSIRIGGASMGWFRPPIFTDIEIHDHAGRMLLHVPRLEGSKSFAALVCHPFDLGEFHVMQPVLHVVCSHNSSNLEAMLAYWLQRCRSLNAGPGFALDGFAVRVVFTQARVVLEDEERGRGWSLDPLDLTVAIPRDRRTLLSLELKATAAETIGSASRRSGQLSANVSAHFVETSGGTPRLRAEGELRADQLPLEAIEPFLRRFAPHLHLSGRLNVNGKICPSDGQAGAPDVRLEGGISLQALTLSDPFLLGSDVLHLQQVQTPIRLALDGSRLAIEQMEIQSEVGKLRLAGTLPKEEDGKRKEESRNVFSSFVLLPSSLQVEAELNLARLAAMLPNALHLTKDTRMQSGTLSLQLHSTPCDDGTHWEGHLHTSDLEGLYQGQRVTWKEPFTVILTAHQEINNPLPVLERFRCDSDFLRLEMSGSLQEWTARGSFNLSRLSKHLAGFIELGPLQVQGEGMLRISARRNPRGAYRLEGNVGFTQLHLTDGSRAWHEDSLTIRLDLIGDTAAGYRIDAGAIHILAGQDGIDLDLLEPIADLPLRPALRWPSCVRARLRFHGDLARWQGRLTNLTGLLAGVGLAGQIDMDGRLRYEAETTHLEDIKITGHAIRFQGLGLNVQEPSLDFTTSGRWLPERATLELQHTRLSCPTVAVQAPAVTLSVERTGAWQITAGVTVQGDVARLLKVPCLHGRSVEGGGALAGRIDLRPDEGRQIVQFDVNVQNFVLGSPTAPFWRTSRINLLGHGVYDAVKDSLQIVQLHLDSPTWGCDAAGQLNALHSNSLELSDAVLRWPTLQALGCQVGAGELRGRLSNGWFHATPIETTLNQGRLRLESSLRLDPPPLEVTLAKGRAIEHAHLTPSACASALGYAVPVLAGVTQADGEFSLDLQGGHVPLAEPAKGDVIGWFTLHSAQISGSPLVQELSVLLKGPATLTLAKDNIVPFRVFNGRVYHTGLELHFPELTIHLSGSVGLDGSLALTAEMPVPPKWLVSSKLAKAALANQTIRLPIGGTLSHPKIDEHALREASVKFTHDAAEKVLGQEIDGKTKKEVENGLKKWFRRK